MALGFTALPYPPYWSEERKQAADGSVSAEYSGTDYQLLSAIAQALNFKPKILPAKDWGEVRYDNWPMKHFAPSNSAKF